MSGGTEIAAAIGLRGRWRVRELDEAGSVVGERVYDNVITTVGKTELASWLNGEVGTLTGVYGAVGNAGATFWSAGAVWGANSYTQPNPNNGFIYKTTAGGTSGGTQPTWPTTIGTPVGDGTVAWTCIGPGPADTQLIAELSPRIVPVSAYRSQNSWVVDFLWPMSQVNTQLTEMGLFLFGTSTANSGTMLSHVQINELKDSTKQLDAEFTLTMSTIVSIGSYVIEINGLGYLAGWLNGEVGTNPAVYGSVGNGAETYTGSETAVNGELVRAKSPVMTRSGSSLTWTFFWPTQGATQTLVWAAIWLGGSATLGSGNLFVLLPFTYTWTAGQTLTMRVGLSVG